MKVTLENHWGLTANPINIRIIIEEVNNPFCEASPDFCNWEHEYLLFQRRCRTWRLRAHERSCQVLESVEGPRCAAECPDHVNADYTGMFALEYEDGRGTESKARSISIGKSWPPYSRSRRHGFASLRASSIRWRCSCLFTSWINPSSIMRMRSASCASRSS